jgi:phage I-like protein
MNFWKNEDWEKLEKGADGDSLRGLPKKEFPWALHSEDYVDAEGDMWKCDCSCLAIEPAKDNKKVLATLKLSSKGKINPKNLDKMGFSSERLGHLMDRQATEIVFSLEKTIEAAEADLEKIALKWLEAEKNRNKLKWTFNAKQKEIWGNVRVQPFSKFSVS